MFARRRTSPVTANQSVAPIPVTKSILLLFLASLLSCPANAADLSGSWRLEFLRRGDVTLRTYLLLRQNDTRLDGKVIINDAVDLPLRNPRIEGEDGYFSIDWNAAYHVRRNGENLRVVITYASNRREEVTAVRVPETELAPPARLPVPEVVDLPSNGLARTPPMGWNSWNHFADRVDDSIVREAADALVKSGLAAAGYTYINIDDAWEGGRDSAGRIIPNAKFPDMKALADYVHARGLKLGIYSSPGPVTCGGYVGSYGFEEQDAKTFAEWGIDFLKYDWCSAARVYAPDEIRAGFQKMGAALQRCGRPIVYSLSAGTKNVWAWAPKTGANLWRTTDDIQDNWKTVSAIGFSQSDLAPFAGPGHWNDPDMLEVGNGGMTATEYRTHFSLWCLLSAPLIAGNDLRSMSAETLEILSNREAIAIDQDVLGRPAQRIFTRGEIEVWLKPLANGDKAIGVFNRGETTQTPLLTWAEMGFDRQPQTLRDLWLHADLPPAKEGFSAMIPSHGVVLLRLR
jgi:alpha-galactosidase